MPDGEKITSEGDGMKPRKSATRIKQPRRSSFRGNDIKIKNQVKAKIKKEESECGIPGLKTFSSDSSKKVQSDLLSVKCSVSDISKQKGLRPIVGLTAYDAIMSRAVSNSGVDFILVGDSVGTTLLGHATTIPVRLDDIVRHTQAVQRSNPNCLVVADLPFGEASYSFDRLLESCCRLMQEGGADAVKVEGGKDLADDIEKLVATGVPVLGHIGLLPQTVKAIGGYRKYGTEREEAESLYTDAITLEEAGCFAIVGEMIESKVATKLAEQILPPLIGIGSGSGCDGQILVTTDLLGWSNGAIPSFVKPYCDLNGMISKALHGFVEDVRKKKFPST